MSNSSSHTVCATFTFKDRESKGKFIDFANGENGLSVTRAHNGCQSIELYESHENPSQVTIWQNGTVRKIMNHMLSFVMMMVHLNF